MHDYNSRFTNGTDDVPTTAPSKSLGSQREGGTRDPSVFVDTSGTLGCDTSHCLPDGGRVTSFLAHVTRVPTWGVTTRPRAWFCCLVCLEVCVGETPHVPMTPEPPSSMPIFAQTKPVLYTRPAGKIQRQENGTSLLRRVPSRTSSNSPRAALCPFSLLLTPRLSYLRRRRLAVDPAQVAIPANGNNIGKQDAVLERQKGEIDHLHKRPDHPVGL